MFGPGGEPLRLDSETFRGERGDVTLIGCPFRHHSPDNQTLDIFRPHTRIGTKDCLPCFPDEILQARFADAELGHARGHQCNSAHEFNRLYSS